MFEAPLLDDPLRAELRLASAALANAECSGQPLVFSAALAQLARCYRAMGALASAEAYLELALRWSRSGSAVDGTVDLLCEAADLAECLSRAHEARQPGTGHAARERARDHAFEAGTLAGRVTDPTWEIQVLLRISDVLDRCGDRDDAVQMQTRALRLMAGPTAEALNPHVMPSIGRLADT
jgi:tetratricopeptide (TPR) repeat protein